MRNGFAIDAIMDRAYRETTDAPEAPPPGDEPFYPSRYVPALRRRVSPVHEVVPVDLFVPGCPPPADAIHFVLQEILAGRTPDVSQLTRFGR
jgi:NAD-reducing hydrogenase small subunit